jgi:LmeA-like phospholipid-binding
MNQYGEPGMNQYGEPQPPTAQYSEYGIVRPRRRHPLRTLTIVVLAVLVVLVGLDFGGRALAENIMASQIKNQGFPTKPHVSIEGFPFLTQVATRDFSDIKISSSNITEGPLEIASVNATMTGVHVSLSFKSGTIDHINGTIDVTFTALANAMTSQAGGLASALGGAGLTLTQAGPNEVKATIDLVVTSGTAVWRITRTGHNVINIHLVSNNGDLSSVLGAIQDINVPLPSLPVGLSIQSISVTPNGVVGTVTGQNVKFHQ